jgi:hypothetical protein
MMTFRPSRHLVTARVVSSALDTCMTTNTPNKASVEEDRPGRRIAVERVSSETLTNATEDFEGDL